MIFYIIAIYVLNFQTIWNENLRLLYLFLHFLFLALMKTTIYSKSKFYCRKWNAVLLEQVLWCGHIAFIVTIIMKHCNVLWQHKSIRKEVIKSTEIMLPTTRKKIATKYLLPQHTKREFRFFLLCWFQFRTCKKRTFMSRNGQFYLNLF
jgi:hypothetical protein